MTKYGYAISSEEHHPQAIVRHAQLAEAVGGGVDVLSDRMMSAMIYAWGQFIDHDMTSTVSGTSEVMSIPVPTGDPSFDPVSYTHLDVYKRQQIEGFVGVFRFLVRHSRLGCWFVISKWRQ